uniref:Uncharacterized protein n=1 Tax=Physcomitrium patens TaxID=3218 RepID=A0A7I3YXP5_PHYPA
MQLEVRCVGPTLTVFLLQLGDQAEEASAAGLLDINRCAATGRQARARWYP